MERKTPFHSWRTLFYLIYPFYHFTLNELALKV
jgi:hypothetical protein